jgi:hypothetical protein
VCERERERERERKRVIDTDLKGKLENFHVSSHHNIHHYN